jgi:hypothetical protein
MLKIKKWKIKIQLKKIFEKVDNPKHLKAKIRAMEVIVDLFDLTGFDKKVKSWRKTLEKAKMDLK